MHDIATIRSEGSPNFRGIGACGDDCRYCLRYKATMRDDPAELRRIRDLWISFGWRGPKTGPPEMACHGCRKENRCAYESLRNCAFGKGLANCGMCAEYPCEHVAEGFARTEQQFQTHRFDCAPEDRDGHSNLPRFTCTLAGRGYHIVLYCRTMPGKPVSPKRGEESVSSGGAIVTSRFMLAAVLCFWGAMPVAPAPSPHTASPYAKIPSREVREFFGKPYEAFKRDGVPRGFRIVVLSHLGEYCMHLALAGALDSVEAGNCIERLVDLALAESPRGGRDVARLVPESGGFYLSHLGIALNAHRRATGSARYRERAARIAKSLAERTLRDATAHVPSFRDSPLRYPADQAAILYSIYFFDQNYGDTLSRAPIRAWLAYMRGKGMSSRWKLPVSEVTGGTTFSGIPRGCSISWIVRYMGGFAPAKAESLWVYYKRQFKVDAVVGAGFREWPRGIEGRADDDSGPIVMGIGAAASGIALMAARVVGDQTTYLQLKASGFLVRNAGGKGMRSAGQSILARSMELVAETWPKQP